MNGPRCLIHNHHAVQSTNISEPRMNHRQRDLAWLLNYRHVYRTYARLSSELRLLDIKTMFIEGTRHLVPSSTIFVGNDNDGLK